MKRKINSSIHNYELNLHYLTLLNLVGQIYKSEKFTTASLLRSLSIEPYMSNILLKSYQMGAWKPPYRLRLANNLARGLDRLHSMQFTTRKKQARIVRTKNGKQCKRGFEYVYSLSCQGVAYLSYKRAKMFRSGVSTDDRTALDIADWGDPNLQMMFVTLKKQGVRVPPLVQQSIELQKVSRKPKNSSFHKRFPTNFSRIVDYMDGDEVRIKNMPAIGKAATRVDLGQTEIQYQKEALEARQYFYKMSKVTKLRLDQMNVVWEELVRIRLNIRAAYEAGKCPAELVAASELSPQAKERMQSLTNQMNQMASTKTGNPPPGE